MAFEGLELLDMTPMPSLAAPTSLAIASWWTHPPIESSTSTPLLTSSGSPSLPQPNKPEVAPFTLPQIYKRDARLFLTPDTTVAAPMTTRKDLPNTILLKFFECL